MSNLHKTEAQTFSAGWNIPGYLGEVDPEAFETYGDAVAYLLDALDRHAESLATGEVFTSEEVERLYRNAATEIGNDGFTSMPMSDSKHDLGLNYWIESV